MSEDLVQICAAQFERHVDSLVAAHQRGLIYVTSPIFDGALSINDVPKLKILVRNALRARAWFEKHGPASVQPLPLSDLECIGMFLSDSLPLHLLAQYSISLQGRDYIFLGHPLFYDYARGVMASPHTRDYLREDPGLLVEFPPKELAGLDEHGRWRPLRHRDSKLIELVGI
jgi:hypothetical protein